MLCFKEHSFTARVANARHIGLSEENKNFVFNLVDMALRDLKTKKAYAK